MMFFIPPAILAIEDEDDRSFMENLYRSYYRLMYHEIFTVTSDPWLAEDILQNVVISLIRNLSTIKKLSTARLVNYITVILTSQPFRTEPFDQFNESNHHLLFSIFYMKLTATLSNQWSKAINQCL